jgi:predicted DNA-binding protein
MIQYSSRIGLQLTSEMREKLELLSAVERKPISVIVRELLAIGVDQRVAAIRRPAPKKDVLADA